MSFIVKAKIDNLETVAGYFNSRFEECKVSREDSVKASLLIEELFASICSKAPETTNVTLSFKTGINGTRAVLSYRGEELNVSDSVAGNNFSWDEVDEDAEEVIRGLILRSFDSQISNKYRKKINTITIQVGQPAQKALTVTLISLLAAIVVGFVLRLFVPENVASFINLNILMTVKTIFLNALKMIIGPVIFFSIASSVGSFSDMSLLGKLGSKIFVFYMFTTMVAIVTGFGIFSAFQPVTFGGMAGLATGGVTEAVSEVSLLSTLIGIVPNNFLKAFLESNTLQLIFLAIISGIAVTMLDSRSEAVSAFLDNANAFFMKLAALITKFLPVMVFSSICSMIITLDLGTAKSIGSLVLCICLADICMLVLYNLMVLILGRKNPLEFIKAAFPGWVNAFSLSSSNAAMSYTMDICKSKLKISPKLYSFSIPLGATVNMDGLSVSLALSTLFFARAFGISLEASDIVSLIITIIILSLGTPGMPGTGILCMSVLFNQFAIPAEALAVFVGIYSFLDPINTANNVFGDIVGTYVIASRTGLIEKEESQR